MAIHQETAKITASALPTKNSNIWRNISSSFSKKSPKKKSQLECLNYCQHTSDCVDKRLRNLSWFVSFFTVTRLTGFLIVSSFLISSVSTMSMSAGSLFTDKKKKTTSTGTILSFQGAHRRTNRAIRVEKLKARFKKHENQTCNLFNTRFSCLTSPHTPHLVTNPTQQEWHNGAWPQSPARSCPYVFLRPAPLLTTEPGHILHEKKPYREESCIRPSPLPTNSKRFLQ